MTTSGELVSRGGGLERFGRRDLELELPKAESEPGAFGDGGEIGGGPDVLDDIEGQNSDALRLGNAEYSSWKALPDRAYWDVELK